MTIRRLVRVVVVAAVMTTGARTTEAQPVLHAQPGDGDAAREAARYFRAGEAAFRDGRYQIAARVLEEALARSPTPEIGFSLAQACRRQYFVDHDRRWAERALELYRAYLDAVPSGGRRSHAVTHIAALEVVLAQHPATPPPPPQPEPTQIMVTSETPGAVARVDGGAPAPVPAVFDVTPGDHRISVRAPGHVARSSRWLSLAERLVVAQVDLVLAPGRLQVDAPAPAVVLVDGRKLERRRVELSPGVHLVSVLRAGFRPFRTRVEVAAGAEAAVHARLEPTARRRASLYVLGGGAVALTVSVACAGLALRADAHAAGLQAQAGERSLSRAELDDLNASIDERDRLRTASLLLLATAAAGAGVAAFLYFGDQPPAEVAPHDPRVVPVVTAGSAGLAIQGAF